MKRVIPYLIFLLFLLFCLPGWSRLKFDTEMLNLLPEQLPSVSGLKLYQLHFNEKDETWITLAGEEAEDLRLAAESLAESFESFRDEILAVEWRSPFSNDADALADLMAWQWLNTRPELFTEVAKRFDVGAAPVLFEEVRDRMSMTLSPMDIARLGRDPLGLLMLPGNAELPMEDFMGGDSGYESSDGTFRSIQVWPRQMLRDHKDSGHWVTFLENKISEWKSEHQEFADIEVGITGLPAIVAETAYGMEADVRQAVSATVVVVILLFLGAHRRLKPLLWLLFLLGTAMGGALAVGGYLFGTLNAISIGFASILLGITADYGIVIYQDYRIHGPGGKGERFGFSAERGVLGSAISTAVAFFCLYFGGIPGLAQLGVFVSAGIVFAAIGILLFFIKPFANEPHSRLSPSPDFKASEMTNLGPGNRGLRVVALAMTLCVPVMLAIVGLPEADFKNDPARPADSQPHALMEQVATELQNQVGGSFLIVHGSDLPSMKQRLQKVETQMEKAKEKGVIEGYLLPWSILPDPENILSNLPVAHELAETLDELERIAEEAGFNRESLDLTRKIALSWQDYNKGDNLPKSPPVRRLLNRAFAETDQGYFVAGMVGFPAEDKHRSIDFSAIEDASTHIFLSSWETLGSDVLEVLKEGFVRITIPVIALVILSLCLTFRFWTDVFLCIGSVVFSGATLLLVMAFLEWDWTLLNLMALPLLLGLGVDYSIHMLLAMRRYKDVFPMVWRTTGQALLLCAVTSAVGFGSLSLAGNQGLADLGRTCATGVVCACLTAVLILPGWWMWGRRQVKQETDTTRSTDPEQAVPRFYVAGFWRMGLVLARCIPETWSRWLGRCIGRQVCLWNPRYRSIVEANLLPVLGGDKVLAGQSARLLFQRFGEKVVNLFLFESGSSIPVRDLDASAETHYRSAKQAGRGILIVTIHLGNWEIGAPALTGNGEKLMVLSHREPGQGFSALRSRGRSRWGIDTLIVGDDPFAFLEVIRRLEANSSVALLMDRPAPEHAVRIEFMGKPFDASRGAAELARATGCTILPVVVLQNAKDHELRVMPPVQYDRAGLRKLEARVALSAKIMRVFEPILRQHPDQWFQFVPVWPKK